MTKFSKTLIASLFTFSTAGVYAAAFQLSEGSTSGLGTAFAGTSAVADNATVVSSNPALMSKFKQVEISAGGILVDTSIDVEGKLKNQRDASQKNIVPRAIIPNAYIVAPVNERFSLGGGVNVNYGLKSDFSPTYSAGFFGGRTSLEAVNFNLSGAYKLNEHFSIGLGVNAVHAKATLERYLGNSIGLAKAQIQDAKNNLERVEQGLARINALPAQAQQAQQKQLMTLKGHQKAILDQLAKANINVTTSQELNVNLAGLNQIEQLSKESDTIHKLKGDKWGFGWNAGFIYEINPDHRIGVAYHSAVKLNFKGKYSNNIHPAVTRLPSVANRATLGETIPGTLALTLPAFWEISGYHKLTEKLAMQFSYKRTDWSKFDRLQAYAADGSKLFEKEEHFTNSSRIALGFTYDVNPKLTLRTGVAYDESASVTHPSISIPDTDRTWYSVGATYRFTPNLSTDFGYAHIRGSKNRFNEEGKADFNVKAKGNLYGLNLNYKF